MRKINEDDGGNDRTIGTREDTVRRSRPSPSASDEGFERAELPDEGMLH